MSAFGTKKPNGDLGVQLTFPANFSEAYASRKIAPRFYPQASGRSPDLLIAPDFQSGVHQERMADAKYMAMAKVQSTKNAEHRMLLSHAGYYGMPKAHLAQRQFANPSMGAQFSSSARQDGSVEAPFQLVERGLLGGVLRTPEGQAYGKARLFDRIRQLDRIEAEKANFASELPTDFKRVDNVPSEVPQGSIIELFIYFQQIIDDLMSVSLNDRRDGVSVIEERIKNIRFTFDTTAKAVKLTIRLATTATEEQLNDMREYIEKIASLLNDAISNFEEERNYQEVVIRGESQPIEASIRANITTIHTIFVLLREYVNKMFEAVNRPVNERVLLSKSLVKSLGFVKNLRTFERYGLKREEQLVDPETELEMGRRFAEDGFSQRDRADQVLFPRGAEALNPAIRFNRGARRREDIEQAEVGRAGFDADERQAFGNASGAYLGESPSAPYGEELQAQREEREAQLYSEAGPQPYGEQLEYRSRNLAKARREEAKTKKYAEIQRERAVSAFFDPDTQAFNVRVMSPEREAELDRYYRANIDRVLAEGEALGAEAEAPEEEDGIRPRSREDLPRNIEGLRDLANRLREAGVIDIRINAGSSYANVKRNFIKRLNL
jgi:hypothetical protein